MRAREYLSILVQSYNPNNYAGFLDRPVRHYVMFVLWSLVIMLVLFTFMLLPLAFRYVQGIPERTAPIQNFTLTANVQAQESVVLVDHPLIVPDLAANQTRTGTLTLTEYGVLYPRFLFFGTKEVPWSSITDLRSGFPLFLILFLLPSMIFWTLALSLPLVAVFVLLLLGLSWFILRLTKHKMTLVDRAKILMLTLPSVLFFTIGLWPLGVLGLMIGGVLLMLVLAGLGMALNAELAAETHHKKV